MNLVPLIFSVGLSSRSKWGKFSESIAARYELETDDMDEVTNQRDRICGKGTSIITTVVSAEQIRGETSYGMNYKRRGK